MFNILATFGGLSRNGTIFFCQFVFDWKHSLNSSINISIITVLNGVKSLCTTKAESHCLEVSQSSGAV